jgi:hypothetical protein
MSTSCCLQDTNFTQKCNKENLQINYFFFFLRKGAKAAGFIETRDKIIRSENFQNHQTAGILKSHHNHKKYLKYKKLTLITSQNIKTALRTTLKSNHHKSLIAIPDSTT